MTMIYRFGLAPLLAAAVAAACLSGCNKKTADAPAGAEEPAAAGGGCGAAGILAETADSSGAAALSFTDPRDCRRYRAVKIGGDVWMAENLDYAAARNTWCSENKESNCAQYGRLYNWDAAKTACPLGWHLSTADEWDRLLTSAGGTREGSDGDRWRGVSKKLRAKSGWNAYEDDAKSGPGTDDYGFSALPGGERHGNGKYYAPGDHGRWWIADENNGSSAHFREILSGDLVFEGAHFKDQGFSARCVGDDAEYVRAGEGGAFPLTVTAGAGGAAAASPRKEAYSAGQWVTLTAVPDDGYVFAGWTGGRVTDSSAPITTAAVRSEASVTASFRRVDYGSLTDERDGQAYRTVKIGRGTWMAENLNYAPGEAEGASSCLGDKDANCVKYGRLYDWNAASEACPAGWLLPSFKDWSDLDDYAGGSGGAGGRKLKAARGWVGKSGYSGAGTDAYGFAALPGGGAPERFENKDVFGAWWTTTRAYGSPVNARLTLHQDNLIGLAADADDMYSVRCVLDEGGSLTLSAMEGGTAMGDPRRTSFKPGERVTITAVPKSGYEFVNWTGGKVADSASAVTTVTVRSNMDITANFQEIPSGGKDGGKGGKAAAPGVNNPASARAKRKPGKPEIEMVFVKGGTFTMGGVDEGEDEDDKTQTPHSVTVGDFYIGKYEVTRRQWLEVMESDPSGGGEGGDYPVNNVSWHDVQEFIKHLNAATGKKYRLPTEAEWEFAARGGVEGKGYKYSGGDDPGAVGWHEGNSGGGPHPVGTKAPNELGIYDMSGNVWEWVNDWFGDYADGDQVNPTGPPTGDARVGRGHYWGTSPEDGKVYHRGYYPPGGSGYDTGFRLALPR